MLTIKLLVDTPKRKYKNAHFSFYLNWLRKFFIFMFLVFYIVEKNAIKCVPKNGQQNIALKEIQNNT